jgi:hypothetical protein
VGGVSGGGGLPAGGALAAAQASTSASIELLQAALEMTEQLSAQLLEGMRAASPPGVGGSVDTWA